MSRRDEAVLEHLMFHRALVDEYQDNANIEHYLSILDKEEGEVLKDPVDEAIRSAFGLVLTHGMDPWAIDLMEFTRLYSARIGRDNVDLIVAGKLVHMAWSILRMQSEEIVKMKGREEEPPQDFMADAMAYIFDEDLEPLPSPPLTLTPAVRRREVRPVSLMELLEAFEEARREVERQRSLPRAVRETVRFENQAHDEDIGKDVEIVWQRIQRMGTGPLPLKDLFGLDHEANIGSFMAVLFLVRNGALTIWQDDLPYGEVFIELSIEWTDGRVEGALLAEIDDNMVI
ncbi:MAG: segregation and condensation protein [Candidatus Methanomethylophilaceae archaeon]|nr:segregation and condensation protein [Candidatus Methanomethylophilaceae archaeon]MDI3541460.1 segregation and condensation protein [Candidatus Methanomethylophilaceae archaeon]